MYKYNTATKPRTKRRAMYNLDFLSRHKMVSARISRELRAIYHIKSIPVRKGDTVSIIKGSHKGKEGKVAKVDIHKMKISIEEITVSKADKKKVSFFIYPSTCIITKLNLTDKRRKVVVKEGEAVVANNT